MSYKPFTTEYTYQIIDDIKEYLEETNKDQTTLDTLDLCHLIGEIERLNNIINELEKYITETKLEEFEKEYGRRYAKTFTQAEVIICNMILNKLQELKGSNNNG